mgnify:CR=1 FL=1
MKATESNKNQSGLPVAAAAGIVENATMDTQKLSYFLAKYGPDFFKKLPLYCTAKCAGRFVKLVRFNADKLTFDCSDANGQPFEVSLAALDNFVL